jgi:outer membrane lipoprotein
LLLLLMAAGCASQPSSIAMAVVDDISLAQVRADSQTYTGSTVRWGGIVTEVENKSDRTWVFVVARALKDKEKPVSDSSSEGRFVASFEGFVDPMVYREGRPLTVVGNIEGSVVRAIGDYDYRFPIVNVRDSHLWPDPDKKPRVYYAPPPYWYYDMYYYHPHPYPYRRW